MFYNGQTVRFGRSQSKELFAYLIDRRGASATNAECRAILWEDSATDSAKQRDYFHHIWAELKETLARIGCDDVLSQKRNAYAVNTDRLHCDYYDWIASGRPVEPYKEYMSQYSWAEGRII